MRQYEGLLDRAAANLMQDLGRDPANLVQHAGALKRAVFQVLWMLWSTGLVQRGLDKEVADLVA